MFRVIRPVSLLGISSNGQLPAWNEQCVYVRTTACQTQDVLCVSDATEHFIYRLCLAHRRIRVYADSFELCSVLYSSHERVLESSLCCQAKLAGLSVCPDISRAQAAGLRPAHERFRIFHWAFHYRRHCILDWEKYDNSPSNWRVYYDVGN